MDDPLRLAEQPDANDVRIARAAPHPDVERLFTRITHGEHADSLETRLTLLAYMVYIAYRDIKETFAL